jgi:DNA-binding MarR family transcriptional regulator
MTRNFSLISEKLEGTAEHKAKLRLWLRLLTCTTRIEKTIANRLREQFDTTLPRFDVISALDRAENGLTMGELSKFLLVSNGNVTGVVARLVADGLVERQASPTDRRVLHVRLTPLGRSQFAQWVAAHDEWIDRLMGDLSAAEIDGLIRQLGKLKKVLP